MLSCLFLPEYNIMLIFNGVTTCQDDFTHFEPSPLYEPRCEKTDLLGFRPGPTQTGLYSHRRWLEA